MEGRRLVYYYRGPMSMARCITNDRNCLLCGGENGRISRLAVEQHTSDSTRRRWTSG